MEGVGQGLTLLHFSPQPEPFLSLKLYRITHAHGTLKKCSPTSGREVDECKPLARVS